MILYSRERFVKYTNMSYMHYLLGNVILCQVWFRFLSDFLILFEIHQYWIGIIFTA